MNNHYVIVKRILDLLAAIILMIVLSPIYLFLSLIIKLDSKGPILFKQKRIGISQSYFVIYKFRTMRIQAPKDAPTHLLDDPVRWVTRIGKILRKTSLDEIPQLINIIRGEMSFVGPRPALWNQYDLIEAREKLGVHEVLPGITGLAQISGRDLLSIEQKALLDGEYVKTISLIKDIKIILKTIVKILKRDGVKEGKS